MRVCASLVQANAGERSDIGLRDTWDRLTEPHALAPLVSTFIELKWLSSARSRRNIAMYYPWLNRLARDVPNTAHTLCNILPSLRSEYERHDKQVGTLLLADRCLGSMARVAHCVVRQGHKDVCD
jgi:hypothetical protein